MTVPDGAKGAGACFSQDEVEEAAQLLRHCAHEQQFLRASADRQERLLKRLNKMFDEASRQDVMDFAPGIKVEPKHCSRDDSAWAQPSAQLPNKPIASIANSSPRAKSLSRRRNTIDFVESGVRDELHSSLPTLDEHMTAKKAYERSEKSSNCVARKAWHVAGRVLGWLESLQEPKRQGCLADMVLSYKFSALVASVITANSVFIMVTADYEMNNLGEPVTAEMAVMEYALALFYVIELVMKLVVHRLYFFVNGDAGWNIFDFFLVLFTMVETTIAIVFAAEGSNMNLGFLRLFRLCKIAKVLRVFRTLRFFTELRLMMDCVLGSLISVFWALFMIVFVLYVFGLLLVQGLTDYLLSNDVDDVQRDDLRGFFGTVGQAVLTLFQATTAGLDWREPFLLLQATGPVLSACFVLFICLFTISVWNIVTSAFVEKAMKLAQPDFDMLVFEKAVKDSQDSAAIEKQFQEYATPSLDADGSEELVGISLEGLRAASADPKFRGDLAVRGIDLSNVESFFQMLAAVDDEGVVDIHTLVNAAVRMRGFATSVDLHCFIFESKMLHGKLNNRLKNIESILQKAQGVYLGDAPKAAETEVKTVMVSPTAKDRDRATS